MSRFPNTFLTEAFTGEATRKLPTDIPVSVYASLEAFCLRHGVSKRDAVIAAVLHFMESDPEPMESPRVAAANAGRRAQMELDWKIANAKALREGEAKERAVNDAQRPTAPEDPDNDEEPEEGREYPFTTVSAEIVAEDHDVKDVTITSTVEKPLAFGDD